MSITACYETDLLEVVIATRVYAFTGRNRSIAVLLAACLVVVGVYQLWVGATQIKRERRVLRYCMSDARSLVHRLLSDQCREGRTSQRKFAASTLMLRTHAFAGLLCVSSRFRLGAILTLYFQLAPLLFDFIAMLVLLIVRYPLIPQCFL